MGEACDVRILYEDGACIALEKPQGLVSEDAGEGSLPALVRRYLSSQGKREELYPVHRLDRATGGAILYAKTKDAAAFYSALVAERRIGKQYLAVLCGIPEAAEGRLTDFLYHDKRQNKVFVVKSGRKGAKEAILDYRVLASAECADGAVSLVEVTLLTGRTHQIRAQFASRRLSVLGDRRYGARMGLTGGRIALWSHRLLFETPDGVAREVVSEPPAEHPWTVLFHASEE